MLTADPVTPADVRALVSEPATDGLIGEPVLSTAPEPATAAVETSAVNPILQTGPASVAVVQPALTSTRAIDTYFSATVLRTPLTLRF
jgi:hypothetical protein